MKNTSSTKWGLILALVVAISFLHFGCMTDKTAIQKVLTNKNSFDTVGQVYTQLHPCINITERVSHDTTYQHDTATESKTDTVGNYIHDTTVRYLRTVATIHDTITKIDGQQELILEGALNERIQAIAGLNANISDAGNTITKLEAEKNKGWYWAYGTWAALFVILVGLIVWRIYGIKL